MPSLFQIVAYSRFFQLLRGRKPYVREVCQYFADDANATRQKQTDAAALRLYRPRNSSQSVGI